MQLWRAYPHLKTLQVLATLPHHQQCLFGTSVCRYLNHYEVLGLQQDCSQTDIKNAFVKLSKQWHPDRQSSEQREKHHGKFVELNSAYSVLSKPQLRARYDAQLVSRDRSYHEMYNYTVRDNTPRHNVYGGIDEAEPTDMRGYYGVPWIKKKLSNGTVVSIVVVFMLLGGVVHFYIANVSREYYRRKEELREAALSTSYRQVRQRALGNDRHAQILSFEREMNQTQDTQLVEDQLHDRNRKFMETLAES
ncbi:DnaJ domain [Trinorchestia longiramus]|nr:DnaJ domain [Trinorchestia longiramus]